jgi:photosystem II stability/assembly factor-like uncharacterized protein
MGRRRSTVAAIAAAVLAAATAFAPGGSAAGAGWLPTLPVTQQSWQMLSAFPDGTAYVFDRGNALTLWHSGNDGLSWDALTYIPAGSDTILSIRFGSPKVGYAVDGETLLRTTDGATTARSWQRMSRPRLPQHDSMFGHALGVTRQTIAVGGELMAPLHNGCNEPVSENIWTSHDGGRRWVSAQLPRNTDVLSIDYLSAHIGVAVAYDLHTDPAQSLGPCTMIGDRTSLYVTRDGGKHFTRALRCVPVSGEICWSAKFFTASTLLAGRNDGTTVISRDGGRSFHAGPALQASIGTTNTHQDDDFWVQGFDFSNQVGYATTKLGGAFVTTDFGRSWTREASCDSAFSLGIGEVAAFDAGRAIAGGPTCVAARVTAPAGAQKPWRAPNVGGSPVGGFDAVQHVSGLARAFRAGVEYVAR